MKQKLPIGIQGFEKLRTDEFLYVDKTSYLYKLAHEGKAYFLSRPRRFGKSLLISALKAYWEGKRELFSGLEIENLEKDQEDAWRTYPVFHFDFNGTNYQSKAALEQILDEHLRAWEKAYRITERGNTLGERFRTLILRAFQLSGLRVVVLVDEYDKSLLEALGNPELEEHNKAVFKGFFSTLKKCDESLQFVFITGVTKFEKVSIFSDLNQLRDISLSREYAGICGITQPELEYYFQDGIIEMAKEQALSKEDCLLELKKLYDGYRFHPQGERVYNPFSVLNAMADKEFHSYWFSTGTPTFLVKILQKTDFDVRKLTDRTLYANEADLSDYRINDPNPVPLLYQTGYLTIVDYDRPIRAYTLSVPNEEVEYGLLESLMRGYVPSSMPGKGTDIFTLRRCAEQGDVEGIRHILTALFADIPYTQERDPFEHYFQTVLYLVFKLLGQYSQCEMHTWKGRIDCIVETRKYVYLFEFKRDGTAKEALCQINEMEYAKTYEADPRTLFRIGAAFDSKTRMLTEWEAEKKE